MGAMNIVRVWVGMLVPPACGLVVLARAAAAFIAGCGAWILERFVAPTGLSQNHLTWVLF